MFDETNIAEEKVWLREKQATKAIDSFRICVDCNHPRRNCHYTVIVEGAIEREKDRNHVIIVGEELGL